MRSDERIAMPGHRIVPPFERRPADGSLRARRRRRASGRRAGSARRASTISSRAAPAGPRRRDPRGRQHFHRRTAARSARTHHAAARAPRPSGRGRHVPARAGQAIRFSACWAPRGAGLPARRRPASPRACSSVSRWIAARITRRSIDGIQQSASRAAAAAWQASQSAQGRSVLHRNRRCADGFARRPSCARSTR